MSACSYRLRQIGHSALCSSSSSRTRRLGSASMKVLEVGGGGLSANSAAKASLLQLPEVTRNLANCRNSSGAAPSASGVQSCSSKYELMVQFVSRID